ncbi:MAG: hypothetical protein ACTSPV_16135 [Candidatus Hodarchaeales archaeon]
MLGWMSEDRNSILQLLIMSTLPSSDDKDEGLSATEIIDIFTESLEAWVPRRGTIYPAINQLVSKGYLVKTDGRPMRLFLSRKGKEKLSSFAHDLITNTEIFFDFIDLFQDNLSDREEFQQLRIDFLRKLVRLLNKRTRSFKDSLEESKQQDSGWKEVKIKSR